MSSRLIKSMETQASSLNLWHFVKQLVRSVSGDNLMFYFSTISWLQLQQKAKWVNIKFEKRDKCSKCSTCSFHLGKTQNIYCAPEKNVILHYCLQATLNFSTFYHLFCLFWPNCQALLFCPKLCFVPWRSINCDVAFWCFEASSSCHCEAEFTNF